MNNPIVRARLAVLYQDIHKSFVGRVRDQALLHEVEGTFVGLFAQMEKDGLISEAVMYSWTEKLLVRCKGTTIEIFIAWPEPCCPYCGGTGMIPIQNPKADPGRIVCFPCRGTGTHETEVTPESFTTTGNRPGLFRRIINWINSKI